MWSPTHGTGSARVAADRTPKSARVIGRARAATWYCERKVGERPLTSIMAAVQIIPQVELADAEHKAMARTGHRDPGDWPSVAARFNSSTGSKMELSIRAVPVYAYSRLRANGCRYPNL